MDRVTEDGWILCQDIGTIGGRHLYKRGDARRLVNPDGTVYLETLGRDEIRRLQDADNTPHVRPA